MLGNFRMGHKLQLGILYKFHCNYNTLSKNSFLDGRERDSPYAMRTKLDEIANRGGLEARKGIDSVLKDTFENDRAIDKM